MAGAKLQTIVDDYLAALRAWGAVAGREASPLRSVNDGGGCVFRKGEQHGIALTGAETGIVFVRLGPMEGGEKSAGSGNNFWRTWVLQVDLLVPDDETDPSGTEDARIGLIDEFGEFMGSIETRTLFGNAKVGHISKAEPQICTLTEGAKQIFRGWACEVSYRTLKSG